MIEPVVPPAPIQAPAEQFGPLPTCAPADIRPEVAPPETPLASVLSRLGSWIARLGAAAARPFTATPVVVPPPSLPPECPEQQRRKHIVVNLRAPAPPAAVRTEPVATPPQVVSPTLSSAPRDLLLNGEEVSVGEYLRRLRTLRAVMEARGRSHLAAPLDGAIEAAERLPPDEQVRALDPFRRVPRAAPVTAAKGAQASGRAPPRSPAAR